MKTILAALILTFMANYIFAQDKIKTQNSSFTIHFVGHGSLYIDYQGEIIHIDPWTKVGDYTQMPDADYVLITHQHGDHLDTEALNQIINKETSIIATQKCAEEMKTYKNMQVLKNEESIITNWGKLTAVPAYNISHKRDTGEPFHPKGEGNGYVLNIDGVSVYIAGDTENIPEMKELKNIDIAFLPMNLPYTMTPEMTADAALMIQPKILYPYHFGNTDTNFIIKLLKDSDIDVRIRDLK